MMAGHVFHGHLAQLSRSASGAEIDAGKLTRSGKSCKSWEEYKQQGAASQRCRHSMPHRNARSKSKSRLPCSLHRRNEWFLALETG